MPPDWIKSQFSHFDTFVVVNSQTGVAVEGGARGWGVLNEHEQRNGRAPIYEARSLPHALRGQPPEMWMQLLNEARHGGEALRESRSKRITELREAKYPLVKSRFVTLASKALTGASPRDVDWTSLHDECFTQCDSSDYRDKERLLNELLRLSPGAVTHVEQDFLVGRYAIKNDCPSDTLVHPSQRPS
jgi:hypothetical protein